MLRRPLFIFFIALLAAACRKTPAVVAQDAGPPLTPATVPLTESYASPTKLFTLHYPRDFAARSVGQRSLMLVRNLEGGQGDVLLVTFVAVETPVSDDLQEFSRVLLDAQGKELNEYTETYRRPGQCFGLAGITTEGTWKSKAVGTATKRWSCTFLRNGHGYSFSYDVPTASAAKYEPLLHRIIDATEFTD